MRLGFSRTRIGQNVEANTSQPLPPFVPGRALIGDIDIGGLQRFGPQSSANLRLVQNVFSVQDDSRARRGQHLVKAGALAEHYQRQHGQPDVQPRHLLVRQPARVPENRADQLRRPDARRRDSIATGASRCSASTRRTSSA